MNTQNTPSKTPVLSGEVQAGSSQELAASKDLAAISYVWVLSLVVYVTRRDSPFVRFHAKQGMMIFVLSILVWFIPYFGRPLELALLALAVMGFLAAAQGEWKDLPVVGPLSRGEWKALGQSVKGLIADLRAGAARAKAATQKQPAAVPAMPPEVPTQTAASVTPSSPAPAGNASSSAVPSKP